MLVWYVCRLQMVPDYRKSPGCYNEHSILLQPRRQRRKSVLLLSLSIAPSATVAQLLEAAPLFEEITSGYATWLTAGAAIRIAHYDVIDDVITRKL